MQLVHRYPNERQAFNWKAATDAFLFIMAVLVLIGMILAMFYLLMNQERHELGNEQSPARSASLRVPAASAEELPMLHVPHIEYIRGGAVSNS